MKKDIVRYRLGEFFVKLQKIKKISLKTFIFQKFTRIPL